MSFSVNMAPVLWKMTANFLLNTALKINFCRVLTGVPPRVGRWRPRANRPTACAPSGSFSTSCNCRAAESVFPSQPIGQRFTHTVLGVHHRPLLRDADRTCQFPEPRQ